MKPFLKTAKGRTVMIGAAAAVLVILIVIAFLLLSGSETAYRSISIAEISGRVMTENNGKSYAAYENMVIGGGYALTTEEESYTRMLLDGDKYMKLEEQSHAVFENLGDPQSHRTVIRLNYGTFTTEITKPLGNNEDYIVNTPNAVLAVRGTFFRVEVSFDASGDAYTDVYTYGGAVACHRIMPDGTEVDEEVMINTGYKARIKMDEIITIYVEELIEREVDHVDPLEMSDVQDDQLVDVYNASAHGHEMFRSTGELWDEIVEREIDLDDYVSVYDGEKIPPYAEEKEPEPTKTFVTTSAPETTESMNPPDNTETQQPESLLLSDTTGSEPILTEAVVPPAETTAAEAFPETASTAASAGNVAAETAVSDPIGTSGAALTGTPAETTAPIEATVTAPERTTESTKETEELIPTTTIAETTTATEWINTSPSAEIVTRPQAFTTSVTSIPVTTTAITGPSHVHTLFEETIAASCTENGTVRTKCSVCGTVVSETIIPALGHNTGSVTVAATCVADGERLDVCKLCGVIVSQAVIPATGHIADTTTIAATCEKNGERTEICRICGTVLSAAVIPAAGHTRTTETVDATCTASGSITVKCSVCGKIFSREIIPAAGHIADITIIAATCEKDGERTETCRICGTVLSAAIIPAAGHTQVTETVEATCTASGCTTVKCSVCGKILSLESIPVTAHIAETATVAATCEENGERTEKCKICGTVLSTAVIPAAGHTQITETVEATCTASGCTTVKCSVCGKILSLESIPVTAHIAETSTVAATCEENGERTEKCKICGTVLSTTVIPAAGHRYEATETKPASCTEEGEEAEICTVCGQEKPDSATAIPKLPHTEVTESDGSIETVKCAVCGEVLRRAVPVNETNFPDEVFRNYILDNFDTDESGSLSEAELSQITEIAISGEVSSLAGIELLPALESVRATVHIEDGAITVGDVGGIDPGKVSGVSGGKYDESTGIISEIAEDTEVTLNYTPEGGKSVTVTLIPDETSTFWTETPEGVAINEENFPDEVFRNYVSENADTDTDGYLSEAEIAAVKRIIVNGTSSSNDGGITSLKGIEYFTGSINLYCYYNSGLTELDISQNTALTGLYCYNTQITELDVSQNTSLTSLYCYNTQITELDVSQNMALTDLRCYNTNITSLDVSKNTALTTLYCYDTKISSLDVSNNTALESLGCDSTAITSLDVSNNTALEYLYCHNSRLAYVNISNNPSISTFKAIGNKHPITVVNGSFDTHTIDGFDPAMVSNVVGADWDEATGIFSKIAEGTTEITYTYDCKGTNDDDYKVTFTLVPDENSTFEPETPEGIAINAENFPDEVFRNYVLENFDTDSNGELSQAEIAAVTSINVSGIYPTDGGVTSMKGVEYFTKLADLRCQYNKSLTELDVSQNTALEMLGCYSTQITELDVSQNTALTSLSCSDTSITSLDVSNNTTLAWLDCCDIQITELNVSNNVALETLRCIDTQITELDVSKNTALKTLLCSNSQLAYVDVSNNPFLSTFDVSGNKHPITVIDGSFDTHTIDGFDPARVSDVVGAEWDEATGVFSKIAEGTTEITYTYDCDGAGGHNATFTLVPDENSTFEPETPEGIAINAENFPDEVFRNYVSRNFDKDSDGELSQAEVAAVTSISVKGDSLHDGGITSLKGVEYFTGLTMLWCSDNNGLTELDISNNTALTYLECEDTQITSLDVNQNMALKTLICGSTQITALDVSNNTALEVLHCPLTQITSLDVSKNMALRALRCNLTPIASLDVSQNTALTDLWCYNTNITSLDVSNNTALEDLYCNNTQITSLDVSQNTALKTLCCDETSITSLDVSRNTVLEYLYCNNTNIVYLDITNCPSISVFFNAGNCTYPIPSTALSFDVSIINGFNPNRVSNVIGADFSPESGIFDNFTSDTITYTYDCDGVGGHNVTFTLVRSDEAVGASLSDENSEPEGYLTSDLPSGEGAFPSGGAELFSLLPPAGFLALAHSRKRNPAFRFAQKAEIN